MKIEVKIHDKETGEVRAVESSEYGDLAQAHYMWSDGNFGCDCNRSLFFHGFPGGQEGPACNTEQFSAELTYDGEVFYSDGWFLKPRELTFDALVEALTERAPEWTKEPDPSLSFRGLELAGETGELCNELKKYERIRYGMVGGKEPDMTKVADELGDVIISAALIARQMNIDLAGAVLTKFNKTSKKMGFDTQL